MSQEEELLELSQVCAALKEEVDDLRQLVKGFLALTRMTRVEAKLREGHVVNADWFVERSILAERAKELGIQEEPMENG